jgi:ABC-type amino acid transport substrate-binding protein
MPADADVLDALRAREVDGVIEDLPIARYAATQKSDVSVVAEIATGDHYVMAVAPDNGGLMAKIDAELAKLESSGRMEQLRGKWFGG